MVLNATPVAPSFAYSQSQLVFLARCLSIVASMAQSVYSCPWAESLIFAEASLLVISAVPRASVPS